MKDVQTSSPFESPLVLAFVCDAGARIESVATPGPLAIQFTEGYRILDALTPLRAFNLSEAWLDMVASDSVIQGEVSAVLSEGSGVQTLLFHAMPLHQGGNEGRFLVNLCLGFRAVSSGPDEVARCRAVLNTAVDAIVTIDAGGIIQSLNPATIRMFGYSEAEMIGQNVSMLMPDPYQSEHDSYIRNYIDTGRAFIIGVGRKVVARKKNGAEFPIHLAVSEFSVKQKRFFTGIIRDLTDLERVQRQLLQAERLAAIGQMVTGLAHESRNALQRAQACLDMLSLDLQESPEQLHLARRATTALQDLHRLYEEVRSYAAPIHLEFRNCDLSTIWRKEWDNLAHLRRDKNVELIEAHDSEPVACDVDVHRMEQVFRNILENAIHACAGQSVPGLVTIRSSRTEFNGLASVKVTVRDNGPGMTPQVASQIFEPFFTTKQKGTGLGMAIVQRILAAHAGSISAKSVSPQGAEIVIIVPIQTPVRNAVRS
ncbi:MAG: two-component system sensor histidine kinase NtrB [Planctomycetota bacterium]